MLVRGLNCVVPFNLMYIVVQYMATCQYTIYEILLLRHFPKAEFANIFAFNAV